MALFKRYLYDGVGAADYLLDTEGIALLEQFKGDISKGKIQYTINKCVCGSSKERVIVEKDKFGLFYKHVICLDCGLVRVNPGMNKESAAYFYEKYYQPLYHFTSEEKLTIEDEFKSVSQFTEKCYVPFLDLHHSQQILMIGCGSGGSLYPFMKLGHKCVGVDFCKEKIDYGRSKGLELYNGHYELLLKQGRKFDTVFLFAVLEHLIDLKEELNTINKLIKEDGFITIIVPDILKIHTRFRGNILMELMHCHNYLFSRETLNNTMEYLGFAFTDKSTYITSNCFLSVYRSKKEEDFLDRKIWSPYLARETIKYLRFNEYIYRVKRTSLYNGLGAGVLYFARRLPLLGRIKNLLFR